MAIRNPRFEVAGEYPGEAKGWTLVTLSSLREFAGFGGEPEAAWERFDCRGEYLGSLESAGFVIAFFDNWPEGYEDFEENWLNDLYLRELPGGHVERLKIERMGVQSYGRSLDESGPELTIYVLAELEDFKLEGYVDDLRQFGSEAAIFNGINGIEIFHEASWIQQT